MQRTVRQTLLSAFSGVAIATLFVAAVGPESATVADWQLPMAATTATQGGNNNLALGVKNGAHDSFDSGMDIPHPPQGPGASFDAYFPLTDPVFSELDKDFRGEASSIQWTLRIMSTAESVMLSWDSSGLPQGVALTLSVDGQDTDMKAASSIVLSAGTHSLTIEAGEAADSPLGGGGASGLASGSIESAEPGTTIISQHTDSEGVFTVAALARSEDGRVNLHFVEGVRAHTKSGGPMPSVSILPADSSLTLFSEGQIVGTAYQMAPDGATFSPPISLTIFYDRAGLPGSVDPDDLSIAVLDTVEPRFEMLPSVVDKASASVTANIDHLSTYAIVGKTAVLTSALPQAPANFTVSGIAVTPTGIMAGQKATLSATVTNGGEVQGQLDVVLRVDGAIEGSRPLILNPGESVTVNFSVTKTIPGIHRVEINGVAGSFNVEAEPQPMANPSMTASSRSSQASISSSQGVSWSIIALIAVGVALIAGLVYLIVHTVRRA